MEWIESLALGGDEVVEVRKVGIVVSIGEVGG